MPYFFTKGSLNPVIILALLLAIALARNAEFAPAETPSSVSQVNTQRGLAGGPALVAIIAVFTALKVAFDVITDLKDVAEINAALKSYSKEIVYCAYYYDGCQENCASYCSDRRLPRSRLLNCSMDDINEGTADSCSCQCGSVVD